MERMLQRALSEMVRTEVGFFNIVRRIDPQVNSAETMYICLGEHGFAMLDFDPPLYEAYPYAWVACVVIDARNTMTLQIELGSNHAPLILESVQRDELVTALSASWKADHMRRVCRWQPLNVVVGMCDVTLRGTEPLRFMQAPPGMVRLNIGSLCLFVEEAYKRHDAGFWRGSRRHSGHKGGDACEVATFKNATGGTLELRVMPAAAIDARVHRERDSLRMSTERYAREAAAKAAAAAAGAHALASRDARPEDAAGAHARAAEAEYAILRTELYTKRMNLTADLARYVCWAVHVRTATTDVGVIGVRREHIPPMGETYEDVYVKLERKVDVLEESEEGEERMLMDALERAVDTLSPQGQVDFYDDQLVRVKMDALLLDEGALTYFHAYGLSSVHHNAALAFYKSVGALLEDIEARPKIACEETPTLAPVQESSQESFPNIQFVADPWEVVMALWADAPGLSPTSHERLWAEWRRRVARYLCWVSDACVFLPGDVTLERMAERALHSNDAFARDALSRLLDLFVHMASAECPWGAELSKSLSLADRLSDEDLLATSVFNRRPLLRLIEIGYIKRIFCHSGTSGHDGFIGFLANALHLPFEALGSELLLCLVKEVARESGELERCRAQLIDMEVLPRLLEVFRGSQDEALLLCVSQALVNLTSSNPDAKTVFKDLGGIPALVSRLLNRQDDLTRVLCILLRHVFGDGSAVNDVVVMEQLGVLRAAIVEAGAMRSLTRVLGCSPIIGSRRGDGVTAAAAATMWTIIHEDAAAKAQVLRERGSIEALIRHLDAMPGCCRLGDDDDGPPSVALEKWQKCAGCVMVLAANAPDVKRHVGLEGVRALTRVVDACRQMLPRSLGALKAALGALAVLSSERANREFMHESELADLVRRIADDAQLHDDERIQMFVRNLTGALTARRTAIDIDPTAGAKEGQGVRGRITKAGYAVLDKVL